MIWVILALWSLGFVLLYRVPLCPEGPASDVATKMSLIIPARDEERNIRRLLQSVSGLTRRPFEVIVVDDDSTDRTGEIARRLGATVLSAPPLPEGWRGKTWACRHGASVANGDALLFLDADTVLKPEAMDRIEIAFNQRECLVLSLGPYHEVEKPYEQLSAIFNLMTFIGMGSFSLTGSPDDPHGLFGPFLLIDRAIYEEVGGHESVRGEILENMSLCALLREKRVPMRCLGGRGVVHTRMYPDGFSSLAEGWTKAFAAGASKTEPFILMLTVAWLTGAMLAFQLWALSPFLDTVSPWLGLTCIAYAMMLFSMLRAIGSFSVWTAILYPLPLVTFFVLFARSMLQRRYGGQVKWKGRVIRDVQRRDH